jgi:YD repeat-containing protein
MLYTAYCYSQKDLDQYLNLYPTIPSTSDLGQHGSFSPPNSYGMVPISIPLFKIEQDNINLPLSLSYNTSGIKVNERPTEVGLGWSININSNYIEQHVNGHVDQSGVYDATAKKNTITSLMLAQNHGFLLETIKSDVLGISGNILDGGYIQDEYSYNFNGYSGNFLYDENGDVINLSTSGNDLLIKKVGGKYIVTNSKGVKYFFEECVSYSYTNDNPDEPVSQATSRISAYRWYLTKIETPNKDKILFTYNTYNFDSSAGGGEGKNVTYGISHEVNRGLFAADIDRVNTTAWSNSGPLCLVSTISFPNGKISFDYSNTDENYYHQKLDGIKIFRKENNNYTINRSIELKFDSYDLKTVGTVARSYWSPTKALKLESVSFKDAINKTINSYKFSYDNTVRPIAGAYMQDYWGYYNGKDANTGLIPDFTFDGKSCGTGADRSPNLIYTRAGILTSIVYPTGGLSKITYEPNYYYVYDNGSKTLMTGGGLRVKEIRSYDDYSLDPSRIVTYDYGEYEIKNKGVGMYLGSDIGVPSSACLYPFDVLEHVKRAFFTKNYFDLVKGEMVGDQTYLRNYKSSYVKGSSNPQYPIEFKGHSVFYPKVTKYVTNRSNSARTGKTEYYYELPQKKQINAATDIIGEWGNSPGAEVNLDTYSPYSDPRLYKEVYYSLNPNGLYQKAKEINYHYSDIDIKCIKKLKIDLSNKTYTHQFDNTNQYYVDHLKENYSAYTYNEWLKVSKLSSVKEYIYCENSSPVTSVSSNTYLSDASFRISESSKEGSDGIKLITKNFYPDIVTTTTSLGNKPLTNEELQAINKLKAPSLSNPNGLHRIGEVIQQELYKDINKDNIAEKAELLSARRANYKDWGNNKILPKNIQTITGIYNAVKNPFTSEVKFGSYYDEGKVKEATVRNGFNITYIWGYSNQYPIIKAENISYEVLIAAVKKAVAGEADNIEEFLKNVHYKDSEFKRFNEKLREDVTLENALITTYTYDPLIGMTSQTDPNGRTTYYEYDDFGRLKYVRDQDYNIIKKHEYNYAGQTTN